MSDQYKAPYTSQLHAADWDDMPAAPISGKERDEFIQAANAFLARRGQKTEFHGAQIQYGKHGAKRRRDLEKKR
jgi:hypothetical protein